MSDERLTRTESDDARLLDAAVRDRIAVAAADLRLPRSLRLTEWQRATVSGLASNIVRAVEDELRTAIAHEDAADRDEALRAALTSARVAIAGPILDKSGAYLDADFVGSLIRRADEHRLSRLVGAGEIKFLVDLIGDEDEAVAEQAMAILIAHSRRLDGFSEPVAVRTELPAELQHRLVWRVAAALRHYLIHQHGTAPGPADQAVVAAAESLLRDYDEGDGLEARAVRLVHRLDETGRLDDELVERSLALGSLPLFLAAIAVRASVSHQAAWEILSDPGRRGAAFLLRAASMGRGPAASVLLNLSASEDEAAAQLDLFDVTSPEAAREALRLWQVDSVYRDALAELAA